MDNNITLYDFNSLSEVDKASVVWDHGVLIADIQERSLKTLLYQINSFYVEPEVR